MVRNRVHHRYMPEVFSGNRSALDRDDELAVSEHMGLAGTAVVPGNFLKGKTLEGFRGTDIAVPLEMDHLAFVALSLAAADTLDLDFERTGSPQEPWSSPQSLHLFP